MSVTFFTARPHAPPLNDERIAGGDQPGKCDKAGDKTPQEAAVFFLNCCFKHGAWSSPHKTKPAALWFASTGKKTQRQRENRTATPPVNSSTAQLPP